MSEKMDIEIKLQNYCERMHIACTDFERQLFCKPFNPINNDQGSKVYLSQKIKELCVKFYNQEISTEALNLLFADIKSKFGSVLSSMDVNVALERINDSRTEIKKFFNASDILAVIKKVQADKNAVRTHHFELLKEFNRDKEESQAASEHLQKCLMKFEKKEVLNVYEKCTLGHHFIDHIPNAKEIHDLAVKDLPLKRKVLNAQQESRLMAFENRGKGMSVLSDHMVYRDLEEFPDEPMVWNLRLLYGVYLFNSLPGAN